MLKKFHNSQSQTQRNRSENFGVGPQFPPFSFIFRIHSRLYTCTLRFMRIMRKERMRSFADPSEPFRFRFRFGSTGPLLRPTRNFRKNEKLRLCLRRMQQPVMQLYAHLYGFAHSFDARVDLTNVHLWKSRVKGAFSRLFRREIRIESIGIGLKFNIMCVSQARADC